MREGAGCLVTGIAEPAIRLADAHTDGHRSHQMTLEDYPVVWITVSNPGGPEWVPPIRRKKPWRGAAVERLKQSSLFL